MLSPETEQAPHPERIFDVVEQIGRLEREVETVEDFYRRALALVADHFGAGLGVVRIELPGRHVEADHSLSASHQAAWKQLAQTALLTSQVEGHAHGEVLRVQSTGQSVAILAVPLHAPGSSGRGSLALILGADAREVVQANLAELRALAGLLDLSCPQPRSADAAGPRSTIEAAGRGVDSALKAARFKDARELAFALTNGLRAKLECEQIAMGSVHGKRVRILSISGLDEPKLRNVGTLELQQAMEECLDLAEPIVSQDAGAWTDDEPSSRHALHQQWRASTGRACVASIPLTSGDECVGVLSLRRSPGHTFSREEIDSVVQLIGPMGPALELLHRAGRCFLRHAEDSLRAAVRESMAPERYGRKLIGGAALTLLAWFCLGSTDYETAVACRLQPRETIQLSAPFQERVAESRVRAGDFVEAGDLLVRLSTESLELEHQQLAAEIEVHQVEVDQAVAAGDWVTASLSKARMSLLQTRLQSVVRRIENSSVRASVDGIVLRGDLTHQIGQVVPQGEPLFELAPRLDLYLELEVAERSISEIEEGQIVRFATNARPDAPLEFDIQQIAPAAEVREGRNVFVAEARVTGELPDWARPGMEGVGKVAVGERSVWRVALKKVMDSMYRAWL